MLSSPVFRYAKPEIQDLSGLVRTKSVTFNATRFTDRIELPVMNRAMFDVVTDNGIVLNRALGYDPDYWFEDGYLVVKTPGSYNVRVYASIDAFEDAVIEVGKHIITGKKGAFAPGIPFWPQVLSQPEFGLARVSNDGQHLACISQGASGAMAFSYRLVNAYGQVSEPACARVVSF